MEFFPVNAVSVNANPQSVAFPQGTVLDGLPNIVTTGPSTRMRFPRPGTITPEPVRAPRKEKETHEMALGFSYVNEIGRSAMLGAAPRKFPVGSIIVRERLLPGSSSPDQLVVMIKHEPAFNPKGNGWEFLSADGPLTRITKRERDGACLKCHASASQNDFIFPEVNK